MGVMKPSWRPLTAQAAQGSTPSLRYLSAVSLRTFEQHDPHVA
jgi:hypothetical protein